MLLNHRKQLQRHPAGAFRAGFPLLDGRFTGVQVAGKDGLADVVQLADVFDLLRLNLHRHGEARRVKAAHRGFVNRTDFVQRAG